MADSDKGGSGRPSPISLNADAVRRLVTAMFQAAGWSAQHGAIAAEQLTASDQAGHASHGIGLLPGYAETIAAGKLSPHSRPVTLKDDGAFLVVDGRISLGQVAALDLTQRAIAIAREHGIAVANLINSHHVGRIGYFGEMVANEGFVGLFWVNVHGRKPTVVPFGAREPRFSTNPHCVAFPRKNAPPFLLDFATAEIPVNKARVAAAEGRKVRAGMLVDSDGRPTDDPGVLFREPRGSIAAFGLHKGSGLAIACELMSSVLGGGPTVAAAAGGEPYGAILNNMMAIVIDPQRLGAGDQGAEDATGEFVEWVKSAAAAEGTSEVLTPGEPERAARARLGSQLEIDAATWGRIVDAAWALGVAEDDIPA